MLKIVGCQDYVRTEKEFDNYLPFRFWRQPLSSEPKLYWRTGNMQSTLLEVEIERVTGAIVGASLVLPGVIKKGLPALDIHHSPRLDGFPIVDTNGWPLDRIMDEPGTLRVFADSDRLLISFSESFEIKRIFATCDIAFGINSADSIVWIMVENLPQEELLKLESFF